HVLQAKSRVYHLPSHQRVDPLQVRTPTPTPARTPIRNNPALYPIPAPYLVPRKKGPRMRTSHEWDGTKYFPDLNVAAWAASTCVACPRRLAFAACSR